MNRTERTLKFLNERPEHIPPAVWLDMLLVMINVEDDEEGYETHGNGD